MNIFAGAHRPVQGAKGQMPSLSEEFARLFCKPVPAGAVPGSLTPAVSSFVVATEFKAAATRTVAITENPKKGDVGNAVSIGAAPATAAKWLSGAVLIFSVSSKKLLTWSRRPRLLLSRPHAVVDTPQGLRGGAENNPIRSVRMSHTPVGLATPYRWSRPRYSLTICRKPEHSTPSRASRRKGANPISAHFMEPRP